MPRLGICKLCLAEKNLQESHLIPAGVLKVLREPSLRNPNPVMVTLKRALQTSRPIKDYLLCHDCEELFSKNGEAWVLANIAEAGSFPLRDITKQSQPLEEHYDFALYEGLQILGSYLDRLVYFALSVFWRQAAHRTWSGRELPAIALGPYQEPIRKFLLGEAGFPRDTVLAVSLWPVEPILIATYYPMRGDEREFHHYRFYVPGIEFALCTGQRIPSGVREQCAFSSPHRLVAVSKVANHNAAALIKGAMDIARPSDALSRFFSTSNPRQT